MNQPTLQIAVKVSAPYDYHYFFFCPGKLAERFFCSRNPWMAWSRGPAEPGTCTRHPGSCLIPRQMRSTEEQWGRRHCTLQSLACPTSNLASWYRAARAALWVLWEEEDSEEEGKEWQWENNQKTPRESGLLFLARKNIWNLKIPLCRDCRRGGRGGIYSSFSVTHL